MMVKVRVILLARFLAFLNPIQYKQISAMYFVSGTTIVIWRKRAFKLSGNGVRPKLKGLKVMKRPQLELKGSVVFSI